MIDNFFLNELQNAILIKLLSITNMQLATHLRILIASERVVMVFSNLQCKAEKRRHYAKSKI